MAAPDGGIDWGFVVRIEALGETGPLGIGFLLNNEFALTDAAVVGSRPVVVVWPLDEDLGIQAEAVGGFKTELADLTVLRLLEPVAAPTPRFDQASPDRAFLSVHEDGPLGPVQLDALRGVPTGAPIVQQDGAVVGVASGGQFVPMTELVDYLDQWVPEVRDGVYPVRAVLQRTEFSPACWSTLAWYETLDQAQTDPTSTSLWTAIVAVGHTEAQTFASVVVDHFARVGFRVPPSQQLAPTDMLVLPSLTPIVDEARRIRTRTSAGDPVSLRHLIAAAIRIWPESLEDAGGQPRVLRRELRDAARKFVPTDNQDAWDELLASPPGPRLRASFTNDAESTDIDVLQVAADVERLCDVIAAKDAVPPLAIGLFGRWGAGKSTFMDHMQARLRTVAGVASAAEANHEDTAYCSEIIQIDFNAWHYMDANLWASMAARLFEGLSPAVAQKREEDLVHLDDHIVDVLQDDRVKKLSARLGLGQVDADVVSLLTDTSELRRCLRTFRRWVNPKRWTRGAAAALGIALAVSLAITLFVVRDVHFSAVVEAVTGVASFVTTTLAAAIAVIATTVHQLRGAADDLGVAGDIDHRARKKDELDEITGRQGETGGRGYYDFIMQRAGSEDYRKHFGLISIVRHDLEKLATELNEDGVNRRIVLYIDDLDRCPPDRVVEVLQAVHLLLAFPLFVVVVGVDPRWLLRSLERQYRLTLSSGDGRSHQGDEWFWESTPQNYLEKIFQIPFALNAMDSGGFGRLVDAMLPAAPLTPTPLTTPTPHPASSPGPTVEQPTQSEPAEPADADADTTPAPVAAPPSVDANPAALHVTDEETTFIRRAAPLMTTPREGKRLINLYRLVRAGLSDAAVEDFVALNEYKAVVVLLAALVGYPAQSRHVFAKVCADGEWTTPTPGPNPLLAALRELDPSPKDSLDHYRRWAPIIERYSFTTALAATSGPDDDHNGQNEGEGAEQVH